MTLTLHLRVINERNCKDLLQFLRSHNFDVSLIVGVKMLQEKTGSVMVIGGGIAGMQAALDAADSGYFVYLVERSSSIGGVMAQLDKTFPTNDCAM